MISAGETREESTATSVFDPGQTRFDDVDNALVANSFGNYLMRAAVDLADVKHRLHGLLAARPGEQVLDVGCGNGVDVFTVAIQVGPGGGATGVDNSRTLVEEARSRDDGTLPVEFVVADAHRLPFPDDTFDATRCERVMMHVADPSTVLDELVRVTRPGGRILVADPDHGMWALDASDISPTRRVLSWWFDKIANPWVARQMPALFSSVSLENVEVSLNPIVLTGLDSAAAITGITHAAEAAAAVGVLSKLEAEGFDRDLVTRQQAGRFFMCGSVIATIGRKPGPP